MIFETFILSFFMGKLRGGKIRNLENLYIRGWYLILFSLIVEAISLMIVINMSNSISRFIIDNYLAIQSIIYFFLIIGLAFNYKELGFKVANLGIVLNFIPLLYNNGRMAVLPSALFLAKLHNQIELLGKNQILTHSLMDSSTRFKFLGDIIPIPFPFPKVISFGDIILSLGLLIVIQKYMHIKQIEN